MVDTAPILMLDVDGVLNSIDNQKLYDDVAMFKARINNFQAFNIYYSPSIVARLDALDTDGRIDMHWLTTWEGHANQELSDRFGFSQLETHFMDDAGSDAYYYGEHWWKLLVMKIMLDAYPNRRFIWIDDDIEKEQHALNWLAEQDSDRIVWISPEFGLTHEMLDAVEEWIDADSTSESADSDS